MEFLPIKREMLLPFEHKQLLWRQEADENALTSEEMYLLVNLFVLQNPWGEIDTCASELIELAYGRGAKQKSDGQKVVDTLRSLTKKSATSLSFRLHWEKCSPTAIQGTLEIGLIQKGCRVTVLTVSEIKTLFKEFTGERGMRDKAFWLFLYIKSRLGGHPYPDDSTKNAYGYWLGVDTLEKVSGFSYKTVLNYIKRLTDAGLISTIPGGLHQRTTFVLGNSPSDVAVVKAWQEAAMKESGDPRWGMPGGRKNFRC